MRAPETVAVVRILGAERAMAATSLFPAGKIL
jgi:hypothetical protein